MRESKQMNSSKESEEKTSKKNKKIFKETQKCSHSYSDESRMDRCANYLSEDLILNSLGGSSR